MAAWCRKGHGSFCPRQSSAATSSCPLLECMSLLSSALPVAYSLHCLRCAKVAPSKSPMACAQTEGKARLERHIIRTTTERKDERHPSRTTRAGSPCQSDPRVGPHVRCGFHHSSHLGW